MRDKGASEAFFMLLQLSCIRAWAGPKRTVLSLLVHTNYLLSASELQPQGSTASVSVVLVGERHGRPHNWKIKLVRGGALVDKTIICFLNVVMQGRETVSQKHPEQPWLHMIQSLVEFHFNQSLLSIVDCSCELLAWHFILNWSLL